MYLKILAFDKPKLTSSIDYNDNDTNHPDTDRVFNCTKPLANHK